MWVSCQERFRNINVREISPSPYPNVFSFRFWVIHPLDEIAPFLCVCLSHNIANLEEVCVNCESS